MDNTSIYFANAEVAYRQERTRADWAPVRRRRKLREKVPFPRRPLDHDHTN